MPIKLCFTLIAILSIADAFAPSVRQRHMSHLFMASRRPIIAGNWKLNTDVTSAIKLASDIASSTASVNDVEMVLIPPFPFIRDVVQCAGPKVSVGAQSCWYEDKGAFTGAVSTSMLKSIGCKYVLVGHSERRQV